MASSSILLLIHQRNCYSILSYSNRTIPILWHALPIFQFIYQVARPRMINYWRLLSVISTYFVRCIWIYFSCLILPFKNPIFDFIALEIINDNVYIYIYIFLATINNHTWCTQLQPFSGNEIMNFVCLMHVSCQWSCSDRRHWMAAIMEKATHAPLEWSQLISFKFSVWI